MGLLVTIRLQLEYPEAEIHVAEAETMQSVPRSFFKMQCTNLLAFV